jgi:hypothetical protein
MDQKADPIAPFELCKAELEAPVRLTRLAEDWRRDLNALEGRRIRRDRDAVRSVEAALAQPGDWYGFTCTLQSVIQDYANETLSIWGDAWSQTTQHEADLMGELTRGFSTWRAFWFAPLQKLPGIDSPVGSLSAWLSACQEGMLSATYQRKSERSA